MHLKRLELTGFKSFADRTQLDLHTGLNAVVGPNGSGKSNIADALRWVLGEQSAKQLRGGKMEDVIFAGTTHRRPLGYAEIVMHIDNADGKLPIEFKEIIVTRRVYRSGESEYLINNLPCRLKDVQLLFMDTGIGRDGYSIIGQGRIDEILSLKSEDRRHVFEEAAGIGKYKTRRNETLQKLERERQNRERVDDIIFDLDTQLAPLMQQAADARLFLDLRSRYKTTHINLMLLELQKIEQELEQIEINLGHGTAQLNDETRMKEEARQAGDELQARAAAANKANKLTTDKLIVVTAEIEKTEGQIKLLESKLAQLAGDCTRLQEEASKQDTLLCVNQELYQQQTDNLNHLTRQLAQLQAQLATHQRESAQVDALLKESTASTEQLNQSILEATTKAADTHAQILQLEGAYNQLESDKEQLNTVMEEHDAKLQEQKNAFSAAQVQHGNRSTKIAQVRKALAAQSTALEALCARHQTIESKLSQAQEAYSATSGSLQALTQLEMHREGFYGSVKAVLARKASDPLFAGICGAVAEHLTVEATHETAIETALGSAAQNIITETEGDATRAINMLKETRAGRATFLPLNAVRGREINITSIMREPGVVGLASALVAYNAKYKPAITQLLGDIIVVNTMENALALNRKYKYIYKIVTLDGERLSPGGAIAGGQAGKQTGGLISRTRKIQELKVQAQTQLQELESMRSAAHELSQKRNATEEQLNNMRIAEQEHELELRRTEDKIALISETLQTLESLSAQHEARNNQVMAQIISTNTEIREAKKNVQHAESGVQQAQAQLENFKKALDQKLHAMVGESDIITGLKIEIARYTERIGETERNLQRISSERESIKREQQNAQAGAAAAKAAIASTTQELNLTAKVASQLKRDEQNVRDLLASAEGERTHLEAAANKAQDDERELANSAAILERELARLAMRKEQLDATSHRLHNEMWEEYALSRKQANTHLAANANEAALRQEVQIIKAEIAQLGDVNVGAIDALEQVQTRHNFLLGQRQDIIDAETTLNELIASLTTQMEEQFAAQFESIAQHFSEVFAQMFNGGQASLRLADTTRVLESGIEIVAQPPGKTLQTLTLLSGGERALTAIALLFAILRLKPSPFCVLDEIESALDDANVARFASYLKTNVSGTQFIVITHRKGTMEAANHLYGVTMQEKGISTLVSVKLEDSGMQGNLP